MLRSPYPIILFWGRDRTMLYNDPFSPILGEKHPGTVGASAHEAAVRGGTERAGACAGPSGVVHGVAAMAARSFASTSARACSGPGVGRGALLKPPEPGSGAVESGRDMGGGA